MGHGSMPHPRGPNTGNATSIQYDIALSLPVTMASPMMIIKRARCSMDAAVDTACGAQPARELFGEPHRDQELHTQPSGVHGKQSHALVHRRTGGAGC